MPMKLLDGERNWLTQITSDLNNDLLKLVYADWLQENGDENRAHFVRKYVEAATTMHAENFPTAAEALIFDAEWVDLLGYRLLTVTARHKLADHRDLLLRLARPALRYSLDDSEPRPTGVSKVGGSPDLPREFQWPTGNECRATYGGITAGETRLAGFVAQINLAEIAHTQAAGDLPKEGLLSFFCFQDWENDNPDKIGVQCAYFADTASLVRTEPPAALSQGNEPMSEQRFRFVEALDVPDNAFGPWATVYGLPEQRWDHPLYECVNDLRGGVELLLGYGSATTGGDPTPDTDHRHLIFLKSKGTEGLHIQIHKDDLAAANFDAIKLVWVDFD